jgi:CheY-like chemotaxis protein
MATPRILIVEDEGLVALDLKDRLESFGYEVTDIVPSGEMAVEKIGTQNPDLVLMDIMLSGEMDGIMTAEEIRKRLNIPVVYLTAYSEENILQKAKITEPYGYIIKPYNDRELHIAVEIALYKHAVDAEKEKLILELQKALATIKRLQGVLPICASCKKIRDDNGYWTQVESYIRDHSEAEFSHSFCPECAKKLYPGYYKEKT